LELNDLYVVIPPNPEWSLPAGPGSPSVADGFEYSSHTNNEWLDTSTLASWASKIK